MRSPRITTPPTTGSRPVPSMIRAFLRWTGPWRFRNPFARAMAAPRIDGDATADSGARVRHVGPSHCPPLSAGYSNRCVFKGKQLFAHFFRRAGHDGGPLVPEFLRGRGARGGPDDTTADGDA